MEPRRAANRPYVFAAILAASAFTFFFGLGRLGFLGPDEPRYAEVAREMFVSGDYISTRLCSCLWFEKPALLYWLSAIGYRFFGVNELAARLPSAIAALMTVSFLYATLHRFGFGRLAASASLVLATSGIFIAYAHVAVPDMILTAATTAALIAAFIATTATGRARTAYWSASFAFMGLGVLAKGLVGIVLVLVILAVYFLLTRQLKQLRWRDLALGLAVFAVVAASWYAPVTIRHGWSFIEEFFIRHHLQRYTTNEFGHPQPIYFFLLVALAGAAPWTFFLIPAIARLRSLRPRDNARDSLLALAWIWAVVPLVFFSFSESKLPGYILPISPALALIIGVEIEDFWRGDRGRARKVALWLTALTVIGMGVALIAYSRGEAPDVHGWPVASEFLPLAIAVGSIVALAANKHRVFIAATAGVVMTIILASVVLLFPTLSDEVSMKSLSLEAAAALRPGEKIGFYLKKEFAPVFYAEGRVLCEPKRGGTFYALHEQMLYEALETEKSMIVITKPNWVEGLKADARFSTEFIAGQGDSLAFRVSLRTAPD